MCREGKGWQGCPSRQGFLTLAIDGWEDRQKKPCLGFSALLPNGECFLLDLFTVHESETGPFIAKKLQKVSEVVEKLGARVVATIADNAANMQLGLLLSGLGLELHCQRIR